MRIRCAHCGSWANARSTEEISATSRKGWFACSNLECGHTFTAVLAVQETLSPSAIPNPSVIIPQSDHIKANVLSHQLERAPRSAYKPRTLAASVRDLFDAEPPASLVPKPG